MILHRQEFLNGAKALPMKRLSLTFAKGEFKNVLKHTPKQRNISHNFSEEIDR